MDARLPLPSEQLCSLLRRWSAGESFPDGVIQGAVCEYTHALRAAGAPPEKTLVAVKSAAEAAGVRRSSSRELNARLDRIVQWCIAEYYRAD